MSRFDIRSGDIEIMDNLLCSGDVVDQTLVELEVINRLLGGNRVTLSGLEKLLRGTPPGSEVVIADLGCGGGDMLKLLADWGRANHLKLKLIGFDANPNILLFARKNTRDYPEISCESINVFSDEFRLRTFDVCLSTLFIHHFTDDQLSELFRWLSQQTRKGIVVNDLHRHWFAFHSIRLLTRLFSKSTMVKYDAPVSVLRAFRRVDLVRILANAGISRYSLRWKWAFRWQLVIPVV